MNVPKEKNQWYIDKDKVLTLHLYIQPGAKSTAIVGFHDGALKIRLCAHPVHGRANEALIKYLAKCFNVSKKQVRLVCGENTRKKTVEIIGALVKPNDLINLQ